MRCHHPFYRKDNAGGYIPLPCGRCPYCKKRRVNSWVFRLMEEEKRSSSSYFITLTYDNNHIPRTPNGYNTLVNKNHHSSFPSFMKRLRRYEKNKLKYYACGEYGTKNLRPHYHAILYNLQDVENVRKSWCAINPTTGKKEQIGTIHIGTVTGDSIAYTAKYIDKRIGIPLHQNDDRLPEFSIMSNNLGQNYVTPAIIKYHKADLSRMYVTLQGGVKTAMPKYYRDQIFTDHEKQMQRFLLRDIAYEEYQKIKAEFELTNTDPTRTLEDYIETQKRGELHQFNNRLKKRK